MSFWYPFLVKCVPGKSLLTIIGRVCMDQAMGSPLVVCMVFISSAMLQGHPKDGWKRIQDMGYATWIKGKYHDDDVGYIYRYTKL